MKMCRETAKSRGIVVKLEEGLIVCKTCAAKLMWLITLLSPKEFVVNHLFSVMISCLESKSCWPRTSIDGDYINMFICD